MSAKCTPGPWALNLPCTDEIVANIGGNDISIAQAIRNPADACLIAAAPELLAALKQAADAFEIASSGGGVNFYQYARELRAAIAKAEGNR